MKKLLPLLVLPMIATAAYALPTKNMVQKPTIVLVHGLWEDGSAWNKVIPQLTKKGYPVIAVQNPTTSLADDAAMTRLAIDRAGGQVILVGHSWGGTVISEVGSDPRVKGLVYVAALAPDQGDTLNSLTSKMPTNLNSYLIPVGNYKVVTRQGVNDVFAGDVPQKMQDTMYITQPPAASADFDTALTMTPAWKVKPSWYVVAKNDKTIHPNLERFMAKRANSNVVELNSSHAVPVAVPKDLAKVIIAADKSFK